MVSSRPVLEFEVNLQTRQAQSMKRWLTDNLGGMFYMLEVVFSMNPELNESVSGTINEITDALDDLDDELLASLQEQVAKRSPDSGVSLKYSQPKAVSVECSTPQLRCTGQLLQHFDMLVQEFDRQWLMQQLSRQEHQEALLSWMRKVSKVLFDCNRKYRAIRHQVMTQAESIRADDDGERVSVERPEEVITLETPDEQTALPLN